MEIYGGYDAATLWPSYSASGFVPGRRSLSPFPLCLVLSTIDSVACSRSRVSGAHVVLSFVLSYSGFWGHCGVCSKKVQPGGRQHPGRDVHQVLLHIL